MGIQERIKALAKEGEKDNIENFLSLLEQKTKLPPQLKTKLETVGNTPIDEPEVYKLAQENASLTDVLIAIFKKGTRKKEPTVKKEISELNLDEAVLFARMVVEKVTRHENEDGSVKTTPNTENCDFPNIFQVDEYHKKQKEFEEVIKGYSKVKQDTRPLDEMTEEEKTAMNKKLESLNKKSTKLSQEIDDLCLSFSGLDIDKLTDWEKGLVTTNINKYINKAYAKTMLGKL